MTQQIILLSTDGRRRLKVRNRADDLVVLLEEVFIHDPDENVSYWSETKPPLPGIYENLEAALREARTWPAYRVGSSGD